MTTAPGNGTQSAPRPRGGQSPTSTTRIGLISRSPPTRGSVDHSARIRQPRNPLPAHAGVSRRASTSASRPPAAPRPRGGQSDVQPRLDAYRFRSPPTRGSVDRRRGRARRPGPLPAHAGVSRCSRLCVLAAAPAPRPRGGQSPIRLRPIPQPDRSPPTRGSVAKTTRCRFELSPLPAHAGVSRRAAPRFAVAGPAPRPRGGQSLLAASLLRLRDRSPPTRGSVALLQRYVASQKPLPAHAGVSRTAARIVRSGLPAPRPRGGQSTSAPATAPRVCRSPPTRGSVDHERCDYRPHNPLPAHAGVSRQHRPAAREISAAPRPRGGQSMELPGMPAGPLRSPPTRGSVAHRAGVRADVSPLPAHAGSVGFVRIGDAGAMPLPAHAGVSRWNLPDVSSKCAAPRPRGGQSTISVTLCGARRRSPPTRGSVVGSGISLALPVPLPAHAGVSRAS